MKRLSLLLLAGACTATGSAGAGGITVRRGFAFAPATPSEAAAYFTVTNAGATPDTLLHIDSPLAAEAGLHRTSSDGGMMHMQPMGAVVIGAHDSLVLAPGGTHLMLTTLRSMPHAGDTITVTLRFARAGDVVAVLPVRAYGDPATETP